MTWGSELLAGGARFRLWAPAQRAVRVRLDDADHPMRREADGWFDATLPARPGATYGFVLDDGTVVPDPAARAQAGDVHGLSRLVEPSAYRWGVRWAGRPWAEAVISEIHVGAFTPEGTFAAARARLPLLAEAGFTAIEIMPVAQFPGRRGWGYDGVLLYAPHAAYGTPEDLKALVDAAHGLGLMVFLDVVYNHFGPDGNYLAAYAPEFFRTDRQTPWGAAIAYERPAVRRFFVDNALYWLDEFRFDGLRFDAVDQVQDPDSDEELMVEIARTVRAAFPDRPVHLTTEDNRNVTHLHARGPGGAVPLFTAEWNDDFHNAAHVIATGETEGYYADFATDPWGQFARALAEGFARQGQHAPQAGAPCGHLPPLAFVDFLQNHDQTGNRAFGERLPALAPLPLVRALTAILLLSPHVPLMFMGEEWGELRPFAFFTDFAGTLADAVREGRRREFRRFACFEDPALRARIPDPNDPGTFSASKLDWGARDAPDGRAELACVSGLLETRRREIVLRLAGAGGGAGRVLAAERGLIAVDWQLDGAELRLRANLAAAPVAAPPAAAGRVIHAAPGEADGPLPPFAVRFTLDTVR